MDVACSLDGIVVSVSLCAFSNLGMNHEDVQLASADAGCAPTLNGSTVTFNIPVSNECGNRVENNGTHLIFGNVIYGSTGIADGIITRVKSVEINFSCALQLGQQV